MHELKELLKDKGAEMLARQVDISVIQRVSVADLFGLAEQLERAPEEALVQLRHSLAAFREELRVAEMEMMSNDTKLVFDAAGACVLARGTESLTTFCLRAAPVSSGRS